MPFSPTDLDGREIARLVRLGELRATDVVAAHLKRIEARNSELNALVLVSGERATERAERCDAEQWSGPLAGVPFVVKDNIDVAGQVTRCGSHAHSGVEAEHSATVVERLEQAGAILLGRANMDEFAMGASTQTSVNGPTRNPVDARRSPGGSSGGCAAAVAAGMAPLAVGTDTGGSIREPASQCGVLGLAPTPDLIPMSGVAGFARGLDRVGPLTRSVGDLQVALQVMAADPDEVRSAPGPMRIAVVEELIGPRNDPAVLRSFKAFTDVLAERGVRLERVSIPDAADALRAYMRLTSVSALEWLPRVIETGRAGPELERRWRYACRLRDDEPEKLEQAHETRRRLIDQIGVALAEFEVLLSPTMPATAPLLEGELTVEELTDPLAEPYTDCWTVVANLTGVPALSVPAPTSSLPIGVMLIGRAGRTENALFHVADLALGAG